MANISNLPILKMEMFHFEEKVINNSTHIVCICILLVNNTKSIIKGWLKTVLTNNTSVFNIG